MFQTAFIVAFTVYFIHATFWPTQVFGPIATWLGKRLPEKLTMPLFNCPICMTPWWGTALYLAGHYWAGIELFSDVRWHTITLIVFTAAGINTCLLQINRIANAAHNIEEKASCSSKPKK